MPRCLAQYRQFCQQLVEGFVQIDRRVIIAARQNERRKFIQPGSAQICQKSLHLTIKVYPHLQARIGIGHDQRSGVASSLYQLAQGL